MQSKQLWLISSFLILGPLRPAAAFNLWTDIEQQTQWTLGENASAGTALDTRNWQFDTSELAEIASYRFLSSWYGGTQIPQSDNTLKWTDTAKIGINLNYFMTGFVNRPPEILQRLVVGPSYAIPIFTTPHKGIFFLDCNYVFGNLRTVPTPQPSLAPPSVPVTSKLNLFYGPHAG